MDFKFKSDKYKKRRGGASHLLAISCGYCGQFIFNYQKDGVGTLKRMYLDRIVDIKIKNNLICSNCKKVLSIPMIYKKESRPALRIILGSITKKVVKK